MADGQHGIRSVVT